MVASRCLYLNRLCCRGVGTIGCRHRIITVVMHMLKEVSVEAKVDSGGAISTTRNNAIYDLEVKHLSFCFNNHLRSLWTLLIAN